MTVTETLHALSVEFSTKADECRAAALTGNGRAQRENIIRADVWVAAVALVNRHKIALKSHPKGTILAKAKGQQP